ncbi:MAG: hypothetical protein EBV03_09990 [Proteobacteria bacterium]|nr:hypothetical protein [Pseudomonadota bacterium]
MQQDIAHLEQYINTLQSPEQVRRLRAWMERFSHIQRFPECKSLDDMTRRVQRAKARSFLTAFKPYKH